MPPRRRLVKLSELFLPADRPHGADPDKLARHYRLFGRDTAGVPPPLVTVYARGMLVVADGVTRLTRLAQLGAEEVVIEIVQELDVEAPDTRRIVDAAR